MAMTPGTYLAKRRIAAGLSIEDVADAVVTVPAVPERDRIDWLRRIEADIAPVTEPIGNALFAVFPFDGDVLARLVDLHSPTPLRIEAPRLCRECACSDFDPCDDIVGPCAWVEQDLCSACVGAAAGAARQPA